MTEEMIVNGIDVSGCEFLNKTNGFKHCYCTNAKDTLGDERNTRYGGCEYNENCYYKQLKRLEQRLIAAEQSEQEAQEIIAELKYKNKKLQEKLKKIESILIKCTNAGCRECECTGICEEYLLQIIRGAEDD